MVRKKKTTKKVQKPKDECFVIMPFSGEWSDDYYSKVYSSAIEKSGMSPRRADDLFAPNSVIGDIWKFTKKAKIIIADLTGKNPNVFYELGLAHAIAKPVILITDSEEDIPFDLQAIRVLKYDKNKHNWGEELKKSVVKAIKEVVENPGDSIPAPFLEVDERSQPKTLTKASKEIIELKQDVALIKKEMRSGSIRRRIDIGPEKAEEMIQRYIKRGMSESFIVRRISPLGPPESWIEEKINEIKSK